MIIILCFLALSSAHCTTMVLAKEATVDGSTMTVHLDDSADGDSRVARIPSMDLRKQPLYPTSMTYPRYVGFDRGQTYYPVNGQNITKPFEKIEGPEKSISFYESEYPLINDAGVTMGESTVAAKLVAKKLVPMTISGIMALAMQRCTTAVCTVETMGSLAEQLGFSGEEEGNAGAGEALVVADGIDAWVFHVLSDGDAGAVWAAQQVPAGHIVVIANNFIIRELHCDKPHFRCSKNASSVAIEKGFWNPADGPVDFTRAYRTDMKTFKVDGNFLPLYVTIRIWRIYNLVNPSLNLALTDEALDYPFSVEVATKLTHRDVMRLTKDHYEGTEYDLASGFFAGPFGTPNIMNDGQGGQFVKGQFARSISQMSTNIASIGQSNGPESDSVAKVWFAADQPMTAVYVPFFAGTDEFAESYRRGTKYELDRKSAWWGFNVLANWMNLFFSVVNPEVQDRIEQWQNRIDEETPKTRNKTELERFQTHIQQGVTDDWWAFFDHLLAKYNDGCINTKEKLGDPIGIPAWWLQMGGYSPHPDVKWVAPASDPPSLLALLGPGPREDTKLIDAAKRAQLNNPPRSQFYFWGNNWDTTHNTLLVIILLVGGYILGAGVTYLSMRRKTMKSNDEADVYNRMQ